MPKPGDVVWIDGWGGVVGVFVKQEGNVLTLKWPTDSFWGPSRTQTFDPVASEDVEVLNPERILYKMSLLFEKLREEMVLKLQDVVSEKTPKRFLPYWLEEPQR